jgi:phosphatidylglycerol:prolipoprotein diacylglycerol transferase
MGNPDLSEISFPGFGIKPFTVDSVAFTVGKFDIAWYAIIITVGMIAAVVYTMFRAKKIGIKSDDILDYALALIPTGIVGARLYYVLAEIDRYHSFKDVINIRNGGLAIYGGIIGGVIAAIIVSKVKKIPFLAFADCCTPGIILAQSIGRWGNFMNGEAYGAQTDIFCRMGLYSSNTVSDFGVYEMVYVHPTFLYESLWNLLGFILINVFYKHKKYDGQILFLVFGWYGLGRMFIEGLRTDSLYSNIFGLQFRTSQILGALIFAACTFMLIYFAVKKPNKELYKRTQEQKNGTNN